MLIWQMQIAVCVELSAAKSHDTDHAFFIKLADLLLFHMQCLLSFELHQNTDHAVTVVCSSTCHVSCAEPG